jgi:hypothetical protein
LYLAFLAPELDRQYESEKIAVIYNNISSVKNKDLGIGFFSSIPDSIEHFLAYETTGQHDSFKSFYTEDMTGQLIIFDSIDGNQIPPSTMESLIISELKDE